MFGDYPEARRRYELTEPCATSACAASTRWRPTTRSCCAQLAEAGLSFRIEHAQDAGKEASGDHTVAVFDRRAEFPRGSTIAYNLQTSAIRTA
nr:hypothetical protein [Burkholderia thailandensis]